ncbi:FMN-binding negative transcriptional regulator [Parasediminibacterium paludis]|uniref:FMN-binding negative transcriptional regulator n=1 Tax=Parasediminibacterium paludis TaxID=908966 RepID=A0ABV8PRB6_9BACT
MYHLKHFKAESDQEVLAFMKAHPFITLCGIDENNMPVATHLPILLEERDGEVILLAHAMRKQNHTLAFAENPHVLAIFSGENAYISASWYNNKHVASTWNYKAVHAKGIIKFLDDKGLYEVLVKLTNHFEGTNDSPAAVKHMDEKYIADNMKAIVAFEIVLTDIQHVFKLSQNRQEADKARIAEVLTNIGLDANELVK